MMVQRRYLTKSQYIAQLCEDIKQAKRCAANSLARGDGNGADFHQMRLNGYRRELRELNLPPYMTRKPKRRGSQ